MSFFALFCCPLVFFTIKNVYGYGKNQFKPYIKIIKVKSYDQFKIGRSTFSWIKRLKKQVGQIDPRPP